MIPVLDLTAQYLALKPALRIKCAINAISSFLAIGVSLVTGEPNKNQERPSIETPRSATGEDRSLALTMISG